MFENRTKILVKQYVTWIKNLILLQSELYKEFLSFFILYLLLRPGRQDGILNMQLRKCTHTIAFV
jgi:hypothetical protein